MTSLNSIKKWEVSSVKEIILFNYFLEKYAFGSELAEIDESYIKDFDYSDTAVKNYSSAYKLFKVDSPYNGLFPIGEYDKWRAKNKAVARNIWFENYVTDKELIPNDEIFRNFISGKFYHCQYCGVSIDSINNNLKDKIYTKRLLTRGRSLEFDKMDPNKGYAANNIALICYWCNNAKTDEFTFTEFKSIAESIAKIWQSRGIETDFTKTIYYEQKSQISSHE